MHGILFHEVKVKNGRLISRNSNTIEIFADFDTGLTGACGFSPFTTSLSAEFLITVFFFD